MSFLSEDYLALNNVDGIVRGRTNQVWILREQLVRHILHGLVDLRLDYISLSRFTDGVACIPRGTSAVPKRHWNRGITDLSESRFSRRRQSDR